MDIDKQYLMEYSVNDNGVVYKYTKLTNPKADINDLMLLPLPTGKIFLTWNDYLETAGDDDTKNPEVNILRVQEVQNILQAWDNGDVKPFADLLQQLKAFDGNIIAVVDDNTQIIDDLTSRIAELINRHNGTKLSRKQQTEALKNRVVNRIVKIMSDPMNYINAHKPIDMSPVQDAAKAASVSQPSMFSTDMNATTKFNSQIQSILGKECVGIEANANKTFNLLTIYENQLISNFVANPSNHTSENVASFIQSLLFKIPVMSQTTEVSKKGNEYTKFTTEETARLLNNLNLDPLIELFDTIDANVPPRNEAFTSICLTTGIQAANMKEFLVKMKELINNEDTVLNLSALINSSTDNAKELTLAKINATQDTIDVYNALVMAGCNIKEISEIMTSPIINVLINRSHKNAFRPESESFSLVKMIDFYAGASTLPFLNSDKFTQILKEFIYLYDNEINKLYGEIANTIGIPVNEIEDVKADWIKNLKVNYIKESDRENINYHLPDYARNLPRYKIDYSSCMYADKLQQYFETKVPDTWDKISGGKGKVNYPENKSNFLNRINEIYFYKLTEYQKVALLPKDGNYPYRDFVRGFYLNNDDGKFRKTFPEFNNVSDDDLEQQVKYKFHDAFESFLEWLNSKTPKKYSNRYGMEDAEAMLEADQAEEPDPDLAGDDYGGDDDPDMGDYSDVDMEYFVAANKNYQLRSNDYENAKKMLSYYGQAQEDLNIYGFQYMEILKYVKQAREIADEISIIAAFGKINQGIETNSRDAYAYIKRINDYFNNKTISDLWKAMDPETKSSISYNEFVRKFYSDPNGEYANMRFDLYRFLDDNEIDYRQAMINRGNQIKKMVNVADLILNIPHFKAMAKSLVVSKSIINKLSIKSKIEDVAINMLPNPKYTLKENEHKKVEQFSNNYLIYQYFMSYGDNITVNIKNEKGWDGTVYNNGVKMPIFQNAQEGEVKDVKLNTLDGLATFKYQMEHNIIPRLKRDLQYKDNKFIQAFNPNDKKNLPILSSRQQYKLPINMARINDSRELQVQMDEYTQSFNDIAQNEIDGLTIIKNGKAMPMNIGDALFLYNLYVNKDGYSQASLTNLFIGIANSDRHIVKTFYKFLSDLDDKADLYTEQEGIPGELDPISNMKLSLQAMFYDVPNKENNFNVTTSNKTDDTGEKVSIQFLDDYGKEQAEMIYNITDKYNDYTLDMYTSNMIVTNTHKEYKSANIQKAFKYADEMQRANLNPKSMLSTIREVMEATYNTGDEQNIIFDDLGKNSRFGWVKDGKIYINTESDGVSWTTPIHELAHLICANIKFNKDPEVRAIYDKWLHDLTTVLFDYDSNSGNLIWKEEFPGIKEMMSESIYGTNYNSSDYREEVLIKVFENELSGYSVDNVSLDTSGINIQELLNAVFRNNQNHVNPYASLAEIMKDVKENMVRQAPMVSFENALKSGNTKKIMNYFAEIGLFKYKCE